MDLNILIQRVAMSKTLHNFRIKYSVKTSDAMSFIVLAIRNTDIPNTTHIGVLGSGNTSR